MQLEKLVTELQKLGAKIEQKPVYINGISLVIDNNLYINGERYVIHNPNGYITKLYNANKRVFVDVGKLLKTLQSSCFKYGLGQDTITLIYNFTGSSRVLIERNKEKKELYVKFSLRFTDPEIKQQIKLSIDEKSMTEELIKHIPSDIIKFLGW